MITWLRTHALLFLAHAIGLGALWLAAAGVLHDASVWALWLLYVAFSVHGVYQRRLMVARFREQLAGLDRAARAQDDPWRNTTWDDDQPGPGRAA